MITEIKGNCQYEGCNEKATCIAAGQELHFDDRKGHPDPGCYCEKHAYDVSNERSPEYVTTCPNCACSFGVN